MASTASGLARLQLRQFVSKRAIRASASCSYCTVANVSSSPDTFRQSQSILSASSRTPRAPSSEQRSFATSATHSSSWPAGHIDEQSSPSLSSSIDSKGKARAITSIPSLPRSKTLSDLNALKQKGIPIVCLTAQDFPTALSIRSAPIDLCLIGDSLANVALGYTSTQPLSLDSMIHHCQAVKRGLDAPLFSTASLMDEIDLPNGPLVIADMPFGSTFGSLDSAVHSVIRLIQQTGIDGVKIEGSYEVIPLIKRLTDHGIPVMGHLGLQPQRVGSTSGYRVQGKTAAQAKDILDASLALQTAGCFSIVLECIPTRVGEYISAKLQIPTIGIGAGSKTDGQILVMNDMIGDLTSAGHILAALSQKTQAMGSILAQSEYTEEQNAKGENQIDQIPMTSALTPSAPKFVRNFCQPAGISIGTLRVSAVQAYTNAVRNRRFPDDQIEGYKIKTDEWKAFLQLCGE